MSSALRLSQRAEWAAGQPISDLMSRALAEPELISLAAGFVDQQTLPIEPTREALASLFADDSSARAALQYGTTPGFPPLREALLERWLARDACYHELSIEQVIVTAGSNQLLHLVGESLLDPDDIVLCTAPTYLVFLGALSNLGARSLGVPVDPYGMLPEALERTLRQLDERGELRRVKAIYLVPYYDNPCGITMPLERRARIVDIARRWSRDHRIHVIADEAYRDLRYAGDDIPSTLTVDDEGDTVIVTGSFSKSFSPGVRVGWGILPRDLMGPVCSQKGNIDFGSPNFSQHLMAEVLTRGLFETHLARIRQSYRVKLQAMLEALQAELGALSGVSWFRPTGGLYVWVQLPQELSAGPDGPLFDRALQEGMLYVPGEYCYPTLGEPVRHNTLRLSFGVQTPEKIEQGVAALARAIRQVCACSLTGRGRGNST
jgi:2-aminoadipate transaminase